MAKLRNYLRTHRRRWHFTQGELAFLFGYSDQSNVARVERDERTITLTVAHACRLLFDVEPRELFPALHASVEERVVRRLHALREQLLQRRLTAKTQAKLELLQIAINRIAALSEQQGI